MAGLLVAGAAALAIAAPAQAGLLVSSAPDCDDQVYQQPFLPWADPANYVLAPGGTFEQGAGDWKLSGNASVASGNESHYVHAAGDSSSLSLGSGSSATSDSMCVGIEHPTLRLFAARNGGSLLSTLKVEVLFEDAGGSVHALPIGLLLASNQWQPTLMMPVVANLLPLLPGEHTAVAFRFTANGGSWKIDDVYVDPYRSR